PGESGDLVAEADVRVLIAHVQEPSRPHAVVDRHADDAVAGEGGAVVVRDGSGAADERATVDPDENRRSTGGVGCPYVEVELFVALDARIAEDAVERSTIRVLRDGRAERRRIPLAVPALRRLRGQ